jgi:hypothetical protein
MAAAVLIELGGSIAAIQGSGWAAAVLGMAATAVGLAAVVKGAAREIEEATAAGAREGEPVVLTSGQPSSSDIEECRGHIPHETHTFQEGTEPQGPLVGYVGSGVCGLPPAPHEAVPATVTPVAPDALAPSTPPATPPRSSSPPSKVCFPDPPPYRPRQFKRSGASGPPLPKKVKDPPPSPTPAPSPRPTVTVVN